MNSKDPKSEEMILNGILEEEAGRFFHICFYVDDQGPELENPDHFIFVPKPVCRIVDHQTVSILTWYVQKKKLGCYVRGKRRGRYQSIAGRWKTVASFQKMTFKKS